MAALTVFDYFVIGVVALSLLIGIWRGVVSEILALVAWIVAFFAARTWSGQTGELLASGLTDPAWRHVAGFVAVFVAVLILFALARWLLSLLLKRSRIGAAGSLAGCRVRCGARCAGGMGGSVAGRADCPAATTVVAAGATGAAVRNGGACGETLAATGFGEADTLPIGADDVRHSGCGRDHAGK